MYIGTRIHGYFEIALRSQKWNNTLIVIQLTNANKKWFYHNYYFVSFACYHVDNQTLTPAQAEVSCGNMGGRLASFATKAELDQLATALNKNSISTEMWLGKQKTKENFF